jgi:hypothetical protein
MITHYTHSGPGLQARRVQAAKEELDAQVNRIIDGEIELSEIVHEIASKYLPWSIQETLQWTEENINMLRYIPESTVMTESPLHGIYANIYDFLTHELFHHWEDGLEYYQDVNDDSEVLI